MLVDAVLDHVSARAPASLSVADVGTGSGAIALAIATNAPNMKIYALDVSLDALAVARTNIQRLDPHGQVMLLHSDLLAALPA